MIYLPYHPDFIFRRKNTAILLVQNSEKHYIGWFLTKVFTDFNLKHRDTTRWVLKVLENKISWVGSFWHLPMGISANLAGKSVVNVEKETLLDVFRTK